MATDEQRDGFAPILIWTRFSLVNKNVSARSWQIGRGVAPEEYIRSVVEDESRLRPRAQIFFRHTLPNIDAAFQANPAIRHVAAASDRLPGWLLGELDAAAARYPWFHVLKVGYEDDFDWRSALQPTLLSLAGACCRDAFVVASCRLDDDDVLAPAFFEALGEYIKPQFKSFCVSFSRGFCGVWDEGAAAYTAFYTWKFPMNAMGLSYIGEYDAAEREWRTPYWSLPGAHEQVDERVPTILDGRRRLFIRSLHGSNDVDLDDAGSPKPPSALRRLFLRGSKEDDNLRKILKKSEAADIGEVRAIFVTI
ncbi:MAG: glycosyltransferase [Rhodospirillales bacterium]|nr:glycosyltransferase [Rhodospirillales bacterium]